MNLRFVMRYLNVRLGIYNIVSFGGPVPTAILLFLKVSKRERSFSHLLMAKMKTNVLLLGPMGQEECPWIQ